MSVEARVETAVINAIKAADVDTNAGAVIRGFLSDDRDDSDDGIDDTDNTVQEAKYPAVTVATGVAVPDDGRDGPLQNVPVSLVCATYYADDKGRVHLAALYDAVKAVVLAEVFTMSAGTVNAVIIEGGSMTAGTVQEIELETTFFVHSG